MGYRITAAAACSGSAIKGYIRHFRLDVRSPEAYFLTSLATCFTTTFLMCCIHSRLEIEDVSCSARMDHHGIHIKLDVASSGIPRERIERCFEHAVKACPVSNALSVPLYPELVNSTSQ